MLVHLLPALTVCQLLCLLRCSGAASKTRGSSQTLLCSCHREPVVIMSRDSHSNVNICSIKVPPALPLGLEDVRTSLYLGASFLEFYICWDFSQWHHHLLTRAPSAAALLVGHAITQERNHVLPQERLNTGRMRDVSTAPCVSVD